ncbi:MAG: RNA polymerase sigma factor [Flavobacteriaceae bacterium]|nr:RNA polymerase sigma factor [Flavobacteriaceae bacterium]
MEELELVKKLKDKDFKNEAFEELLNQYKERLYWHIRHMLKSHEDTDDVLQNVFIKVYKNIDKFQGNSKLYSWMYRIATNESITFLNKRAKRLQISDQDLQQKMIDDLKSDVYFEGEEIQIKLQQAIAQLPEKQKEVFNLKYFQEMKYKDIADLLDTSVGALKASYHHATKKIEDFLKSN